MRSFLFSVLLALFVSPSLLHAVPSLGVATEMASYAYNGSEPDDEYINYFASTLFPSIDGNEGFVVGASGSDLIVFSSYDPSLTNIYLMSNTGGDNFPITFGGQVLSYMGDVGQINGYVNPARTYYGTLLPGTLSAWTTHTFGRTYYLYRAPLVYSGSLSLGDYFFSAADINGRSGLQFTNGKNDDFSPETSSATGGYHQEIPIPEPGTLMLLGTGVFGMGLFRLGRKG